jgi:zinc/manganese transport system permease protein
MFESLATYLGYGFVQQALLAGTLAAVLGAVVGYFVIVRNVGFAAHALSHIGFTGAAAAGVFGFSPLAGMLLFTTGAGVAMGVSGDRLQRSDMAIGMVLSGSLGLGTLFLYFQQGFATQGRSILFGNILGVAPGQVVIMAILALITLGALSLFARRLLFASVQPRLAEARGLSLTALSVAFMIVLAVSVTLASQIVGILLVFTLVIAPAGIALRLSHTFWRGLLTSILIGVVAVWSGILLACVTDWPVTFWITTLLFVFYLGVEIFSRCAGHA